MSDDPRNSLPPADPSATVDPIVSDLPRRSSRDTIIVCEFCECRLTPRGDYVALSERAKQLRRAEEQLADAKTEISGLESDLKEMDRKLKEAIASLDAVKGHRSFLPI